MNDRVAAEVRAPETVAGEHGTASAGGRPVGVPFGQYWLIEAGAPHSSAATQEAHSVLERMSRTRR
jgi:hypothetical protein